MGCCDSGPNRVSYARLQQLGGQAREMLARTPIEHDWGRDGWDPFTPVVIAADDAQVFALSVSNGRGVVTGTQPGDGALRVAYLRAGTNWADGEVASVVWGPVGDWDGSNAQQGHLHRVREISPGLWEGIAIWTSVVNGADFSFLHCNAVRFDGVNLLSGMGASGFGSGDATYLDRTSRIVAHRRFNFGSWINEYTLAHPERLQHLVATDLATVSGLSDATFNETTQAVLGPPGVNDVVQIVDPTHTTAVAVAADLAGEIVPAGGDSQKRWTPYGFASRVIGGAASSVTVEAVRWQWGSEDRPDWSDGRVRRGAVTPNGSVPVMPLGPGLHGLWAAHFHDGSAGAWGSLSMRCLGASDC